MRTSLNEIKLIDDHLFGTAAVEDKLLLDALLILDAGMSVKIEQQKKIHFFIQQYSRKKMKAEIEAVHRQLFNEPLHQSFRQKILGLFYGGS